MAKREELIEVDLFADHVIEVPPKRHKKHKKHKKKKQQQDYESDAVDVVNDIPDQPTIFSMTPDSPSIGNKNASSVSFAELSAVDKLKSQQQSTPKSIANSSKSSQKRKKGRNKDSGTSSEEERWLDAIESGKLEQVDDELKKIKDPKLMTARQRAMYERSTDKDSCPGVETLMALPSGYKEKVLTAEAIQKAQIKSQKRKQLADEKREKDKKKTMERLLKKQDSKMSKNIKNRPAKSIVPVISWISNIMGTKIIFPPNIEMPIQLTYQKMPTELPQPIQCAMCSEPKKYNCSRTNIPLCSFRCYKLNVASLKKIMC